LRVNDAEVVSETWGRRSSSDGTSTGTLGRISARWTVTPAATRRFDKHVTPADAVVQRVEAAARLPLSSHVEPSLKLSHLIDAG
jgi:hypothetical protein